MRSVVGWGLVPHLLSRTRYFNEDAGAARDRTLQEEIPRLLRVDAVGVDERGFDAVAGVEDVAVHDAKIRVLAFFQRPDAFIQLEYLRSADGQRV